MPELKFTKSTDAEHKVKLDSTLVSAAWRNGVAVGGQTADFEVITSFVGNGAAVRIVGKSENGRKLGKIKDVINNNKYVGWFEIPQDVELDDEVYFEVELPKNGVSGESDRIPCVPPIEVSNLRWSAPEARRGDILTLSADVENARPQTEVTITIYEHDADGAHDRITELPAVVQNKRIEAQWEYEYHEDVDEIPTQEELERYGRSYNPPEYFFTLRLGDVAFGGNQESGLLLFKDWIDIEVLDTEGKPAADQKYILHLPDGSKREGTLDAEGRAVEREIPPGHCRVELPEFEA